jgi:hypothetical protein
MIIKLLITNKTVNSKNTLDLAIQPTASGIVVTSPNDRPINELAPSAATNTLLK